MTLMCFLQPHQYQDTLILICKLNVNTDFVAKNLNFLLVIVMWSLIAFELSSCGYKVHHQDMNEYCLSKINVCNKKIGVALNFIFCLTFK